MRLQDLFANARQEVHVAEPPSLCAGEWEYVLGVPAGEQLECSDCENALPFSGAVYRRFAEHLAPCALCGGNMVLVREWRELVPEPGAGEGSDG